MKYPQIGISSTRPALWPKTRVIQVMRRTAARLPRSDCSSQTVLISWTVAHEERAIGNQRRLALNLESDSVVRDLIEYDSKAILRPQR